MFKMLFQIVIPLVAVVAAVIISLDKTVKNKTLWILIPVAVGGFSFVATSFSVVTGGQMAVKVSPGNNVATFNGIGFVPPFTKVVKFDRRGTVDSSICLNGNEVQETCDDSIVVNGKDGGKLFVDLDLVYALDTACPTEANPNKGCLDEAARASVVSNYLSFKTNEGLKRQIRNTAKDALGEVSAKYTAVDILTEYRAQVQELAQELIATRIEQKLGIRVVTVNFTQIRSTQATEEAVDLKQRAVQEVGIAKLEQEKAAIVKETELRNAAADANILLVQANAEKEANLERTKGLTPEVLQDRYYQAIGKAGTVVTDGQTPVIIGK